MKLNLKNPCICDPKRPETFASNCPEHGEGTWYHAYNMAVGRGDWLAAERLYRDRPEGVDR